MKTKKEFTQKLRKAILEYFEIEENQINLEEELPSDFTVASSESYGSLYTDYRLYNAYVVHELGIVELPKKLMGVRDQSNADGSWNDSYGYDYDYISSLLDGNPLFIIIKTEWEYSCNGSSDAGETMDIYKVHDFKKRLKEIEADGEKKWMDWLS